VNSPIIKLLGKNIICVAISSIFLIFLFCNFKFYSLFFSDAVKDFFPNESILVIKTYMSDWLKQAPKRK